MEKRAQNRNVCINCSSIILNQHKKCKTEQNCRYYLRTKAAVNAIQFTVDKAALTKNKGDNIEPDRAAVLACSLENPQCDMCAG